MHAEGASTGERQGGRKGGREGGRAAREISEGSALPLDLSNAHDKKEQAAVQCQKLASIGLMRGEDWECNRRHEVEGSRGEGKTREICSSTFSRLSVSFLSSYGLPFFLFVPFSTPPLNGPTTLPFVPREKMPTAFQALCARLSALENIGSSSSPDFQDEFQAVGEKLRVFHKKATSTEETFYGPKMKQKILSAYARFEALEKKEGGGGGAAAGGRTGGGGGSDVDGKNESVPPSPAAAAPSRGSSGGDGATAAAGVTAPAGAAGAASPVTTSVADVDMAEKEADDAKEQTEAKEAKAAKAAQETESRRQYVQLKAQLEGMAESPLKQGMLQALQAMEKTIAEEAGMGDVQGLLPSCKTAHDTLALLLHQAAIDALREQQQAAAAAAAAAAAGGRGAGGAGGGKEGEAPPAARSSWEPLALDKAAWNVAPLHGSYQFAYREVDGGDEGDQGKGGPPRGRAPRGREATLVVLFSAKGDNA